jgi:mannosyltransferase OCH1-like enzyme
MIPKTIFQTYGCDYSELPSYIKNCTETWQEKNPEFEYVYMSEKQCYEFILENYDKRHADIYSGLKHKAMKGDWWRYLIVNKLGGIYMDIDTVCRKPILSELDMSHNFITTLDLVPDALFTQWGFASIANHPILNDLINHILDNYDMYPSNKKLIKTDLTGPTAFQKSIENVLGTAAKDLIDITAAKTNADKDFAESKSINIEDAIMLFNQHSNCLENKVKLYFWTYNNVARHFTAAWRWSDNTIDKNIINNIMGHKCDNISYEYADIKIKLKNKSYSSFGWSK